MNTQYIFSQFEIFATSEHQNFRNWLLEEGYDCVWERADNILDGIRQSLHNQNTIVTYSNNDDLFLEFSKLCKRTYYYGETELEMLAGFGIVEEPDYCELG